MSSLLLKFTFYNNYLSYLYMFVYWLCGLMICLICGQNLICFFQPFISLQVIGVCGEIIKVSFFHVPLLMTCSKSVYIVHISVSIMILCSFPQKPLAAMKWYFLQHILSGNPFRMDPCSSSRLYIQAIRVKLNKVKVTEILWCIEETYEHIFHM